MLKITELGKEYLKTLGSDELHRPLAEDILEDIGIFILWYMVKVKPTWIDTDDFLERFAPSDTYWKNLYKKALSNLFESGYIEIY